LKIVLLTYIDSCLSKINVQTLDRFKILSTDLAGDVRHGRQYQQIQHAMSTSVIRLRRVQNNWFQSSVLVIMLHGQTLDASNQRSKHVTMTYTVD